MKQTLALFAFAATLAFAQNAPKPDPKPACPQQKCCCKGCAKKDPASCKAKKDCPRKAECPKDQKG